MTPTSLIGLAIITVAVLPGSMYTWALERQVSAYGANFADRVLRFVALSVIFHLALGWIEYWFFRAAFDGEKFEGGQFALAWTAVALLVAVPATFGTVVGGLYASRSDREGWTWIQNSLVPSLPTLRADRTHGDHCLGSAGVSMARTESNRNQASSIDKKGGYTGGRPAGTVPPPARIPSATIRPAPSHRKPRPAGRRVTSAMTCDGKP